MTVKLKNNPFSFTTQLLNLQAAGKTNAMLPPWFAAMQLHPPAPKPQSQVIPADAQQFQQPDARQTLWKRQMADAHRISRRSRVSAAYKPHMVRSAPEIVYAEDQVREVFYRRHPFELDRPRVLAERLDRLGRVKWTSIHGGDARVPLSGESVVQRTLYLMSKEGGLLSRHEAYAKALGEFYAERAEEERKELAARDLAARAGADLSATATPAAADAALEQGGAETAAAPAAPAEPEDLVANRPNTRAFIRIEEAELEDSRLFNKDVMDAQEAKKQLQEKLSAFEQRKLKPDGTGATA
ncbi:mitochondrial ribosomal protein S25-domain-containing protein [Entophlyctis helioformis]|nr:mitochondrial ribosomal protein S25-domain-containing protein [Entophlyctis helioformis]